MTEEERHKEGEGGDQFRPQDDALQKAVDDLRQRIDGNRLGPRDKTPERRLEPEKEKTDRGGRESGNRRRRSSDLEDEAWREARRERQRKDRRDRGSRARSLSPGRRPEPAMSPWSALGKTGRPEGYSRQQVNAMGVAPALQIAGWQREEDRHREAIITKPGS